jgi:hypothetical protein
MKTKTFRAADGVTGCRGSCRLAVGGACAYIYGIWQKTVAGFNDILKFLLT